MSKIRFKKFQGTGNDFIMINGIGRMDRSVITQLCDRKFGIGADGLILMNQDSDLDFDMMYYNADGSESFCGNGSRCSIRYAQEEGWITDRCTFNSNDGVHEGIIEGDIVKLKMHDVLSFEKNDGDYVINTGSPHYIRYVNELESFDVVKQAKKIRYSERYAQEGINVNFIDPTDSYLAIRTYERGVEDLTLSCGTGVTAAALAHYIDSKNEAKHYSQKVVTDGGELEVQFNYQDGIFTEIYLCGPAKFVFEGSIEI